MAMLIWAALPMAADWQGQLSDGTRVEVDSQTHRAWQLDHGQRHPLWDGVHRLADGSVVIVREGTAVPQAGMLDAWSRPEAPEIPETGARSADCGRLVDHACGKGWRCVRAEPCRVARQLGAMADAAETAEAADAFAAQCREALGSAFFVPCD
ncbi:hypothetical protein [Thiorhodococcus fuscus]|uniref:Uncharacterized protein n=1 Tax=Thiorhodococcus fuscus TaxID=527200 RepID=A0ABW4Y5E7_9GAMM